MPTREEEALRALGKAFRAERERQGLSQEELGFRSELDRTYISGIERGIRNPTFLSIRRIADALQCEPSKLLRDAGA